MTNRFARPHPAGPSARDWEVRVETTGGQPVEIVKTGLTFRQAQIRCDRINEIARRGAGTGKPKRIPPANIFREET